MDLCNIRYWRLALKSAQKLEIWLQLEKSTGIFIWRPKYSLFCRWYKIAERAQYVSEMVLAHMVAAEV